MMILWTAQVKLKLKEQSEKSLHQQDLHRALSPAVGGCLSWWIEWPLMRGSIAVLLTASISESTNKMATWCNHILIWWQSPKSILMSQSSGNNAHCCGDTFRTHSLMLCSIHHTSYFRLHPHSACRCLFSQTSVLKTIVKNGGRAHNGNDMAIVWPVDINWLCCHCWLMLDCLIM